jgi:hypothetical protein
VPYQFLGLLNFKGMGAIDVTYCNNMKITCNNEKGRDAGKSVSAFLGKRCYGLSGEYVKMLT